MPAVAPASMWALPGSIWSHGDSLQRGAPLKQLAQKQHHDLQQQIRPAYLTTPRMLGQGTGVQASCIYKDQVCISQHLPSFGKRFSYCTKFLRSAPSPGQHHVRQGSQGSVLWQGSQGAVQSSRQGQQKEARLAECPCWPAIPCGSHPPSAQGKFQQKQGGQQQRAVRLTTSLTASQGRVTANGRVGATAAVYTAAILGERAGGPCCQDCCVWCAAFTTPLMPCRVPDC